MALTLSGEDGITYANLNSQVTTLLQPKNWIINGQFEIWQRGTSQTATDYGSDDRWANVNGTSTKTHSQQTFTVGQTDVPNNPKYFSRTIVTSGGTSGYLVAKMQRIEDVSKFSNKVVTVSFWAKSDATRNLSIELGQIFGTGGSSPVRPLGSQKFALSTTWQRFTKTVTLPSVSGKTITSDNRLELISWFDAGSDYIIRTDGLGNQSGTFDIANISLVEGSVAIECQNQPYSDVLRECQDYYRRGLQYSNGMTGATSEGYLYASFNTMRKVPVARVIAGSALTNCISEINVAERTPTSFLFTPSANSLAMITVGATYSATGKLIILKSDIIELDAEL